MSSNNNGNNSGPRNSGNNSGSTGGKNSGGSGIKLQRRGRQELITAKVVQLQK